MRESDKGMTKGKGWNINMGIKKKFLIGWLAFEAVGLMFALPATAQIVERVIFSIPPRAAHVVIPVAPGFTEILVASNAPFTILSQGAVGEMQLGLRVSGTINGTAYGTQAQNPGAITGCVIPVSPALTSLYTAVRKTAANRGEVVSQAVLVQIKYDPALKPVFSVKTLNQPQAKSALQAAACSAATS